MDESTDTGYSYRTCAGASEALEPRDGRPRWRKWTLRAPYVPRDGAKETPAEQRGRLRWQALLNIRPSEITWVEDIWVDAAGEMHVFSPAHPHRELECPVLRQRTWIVPSQWVAVPQADDPATYRERVHRAGAEDGPYTVFWTDEGGLSCNCPRGVQSHNADDGTEAPCAHKEAVRLGAFFGSAAALAASLALDERVGIAGSRQRAADLFDALLDTTAPPLPREMQYSVLAAGAAWEALVVLLVADPALEARLRALVATSAGDRAMAELYGGLV